MLYLWPQFKGCWKALRKIGCPAPKYHMEAMHTAGQSLGCIHIHDGVFDPESNFAKRAGAKHMKVTPRFHNSGVGENGQVKTRKATKKDLQRYSRKAAPTHDLAYASSRGVWNQGLPSSLI